MLHNCLFDVVININSMQEMNIETTQYYFKYIRGHVSETGLFYCSNRLEKKMPLGEVSRFNDYPWSEADIYIYNERCPWVVFFLDKYTSNH